MGESEPRRCVERAVNRAGQGLRAAPQGVDRRKCRALADAQCCVPSWQHPV